MINVQRLKDAPMEGIQIYLTDQLHELMLDTVAFEKPGSSFESEKSAN